MKKKLLVLLITVIPALMPNLASAMAVDLGDIPYCGPESCGGHPYPCVIVWCVQDVCTCMAA